TIRALLRALLKKRRKRSSCFFFSSRRRHTRSKRDWSSDVCSSDLVDVAKRSLQLTQEQFQANGLEIGDQHKVRVMDVFNYLDYAKTHDLRFDIVVLDPPSFSRTKKHTFQASKDYRNLVASALSILNTGGYLVSSTNAANMTKEDFIKQIGEGSDDARVDIMHVA